MWLTKNENFVKLERFTGDQFYAYQGGNNLFWEKILNQSVWQFLEHAWSRLLYICDAYLLINVYKLKL